MKGAHYSWSWRVKTLAMDHRMHMEDVPNLARARSLARQWSKRLEKKFTVLERYPDGLRSALDAKPEFWLVYPDPRRPKASKWGLGSLSSRKRHLKRLLPILLIWSLLAPFQSDCQAAKSDLWSDTLDLQQPWGLPIGKQKYPGFYEFDCGDKSQLSLSECQRRVEVFYMHLYPGQIQRRPIIRRMLGRGSPGVAATTHLEHETQDPHNVRMGTSRPLAVVEMYVDTDARSTADTLHHELIHAYDATQRGDCNFGNHFFEEGMAVMSSYVLRPGALEYYDDLKILREWKMHTGNPEIFRKRIFTRSEHPHPVRIDYPLAGFFMMQVLTYGGPGACRDLITNSKMDESALRQSVWAHSGMSEDEFWKTVWENLRVWIRQI